VGQSVNQPASQPASQPTSRPVSKSVSRKSAKFINYLMEGFRIDLKTFLGLAINNYDNLYHKRQKFRGLLGLSVMRGKVSRFFPPPPSCIMVFQFYKTATSISTKALRSSREFSLKLSLAYSEMEGSTLLTHVCADFMLSRTRSRMT